MYFVPCVCWFVQFHYYTIVLASQLKYAVLNTVSVFHGADIWWWLLCWYMQVMVVLVIYDSGSGGLDLYLVSCQFLALWYMKSPWLSSSSSLIDVIYQPDLTLGHSYLSFVYLFDILGRGPAYSKLQHWDHRAVQCTCPDRRIDVCVTCVEGGLNRSEQLVGYF